MDKIAQISDPSDSDNEMQDRQERQEMTIAVNALSDEEMEMVEPSLATDQRNLLNKITKGRGLRNKNSKNNPV